MEFLVSSNRSTHNGLRGAAFYFLVQKVAKRVRMEFHRIRQRPEAVTDRWKGIAISAVQIGCFNHWKLSEISGAEYAES